jgi:hypothetical protein
MNQRKKSGVIWIIIGICVPLIALPFVSGYSSNKGFFDNFYKIGIQIKKDPHGMVGNEPLAHVDSRDGKGLNWSILIPKRIPFRFFLVITLIFLYVGIVRIAPPRREQDGE